MSPAPFALRASRVLGAAVLVPRPIGDLRGDFVRMADLAWMADQGLPLPIAQINGSRSLFAGTLRGLHAQRPPAAEIKLVRCVRGAVFDVWVDLRPDSPSFGAWDGVVLDAEARLQAYVPAGCAHGYLTLQDGAEVSYTVSAPYAPDLGLALAFDDPAVGIDWPALVRHLSERDRENPRLAQLRPQLEALRGLMSGGPPG